MKKENRTIEELGDAVCDAVDRLWKYLRKNKKKDEKYIYYLGKLMAYVWLLQELGLIENNFDWADKSFNMIIKLKKAGFYIPYC